MKLLLATSNHGKATELAAGLGGLPLEILTLRDFPDVADIEETGTTYEENAVLKARHFRKHAKLPTIADDSGVIVDAIAGELGVKTRRWGAGPEASDAEWIAYFLKRMEGETNRRARFVCTLAYIDDGEALHLFEGECRGRITTALEGPVHSGIPMSACFVPDGYDRVLSAMSVDEKNTVSHRGDAVLKLKEFLLLHLPQA